MAKGVINLQKESGGIIKISPADGTGVTEVTVPESGELATKDYTDLKVALAQFTGVNQNLTGNGYQKLPGGLIIQWGFAPITASGVPVTIFPITFSNACFSVVATPDPTINSIASPIVYGFTKTSFRLDAIDGSTGNAHWIAIGY